MAQRLFTIRNHRCGIKGQQPLAENVIIIATLLISLYTVKTTQPVPGLYAGSKQWLLLYALGPNEERDRVTNALTDCERHTH